MSQTPPTLWFDLEDLFEYAESGSRPSGIQRVVFEICSALVHDADLARRVRFIRHHGVYPRFVEVTWTEIEDLVRKLSAPRAREASKPRAISAETVAPRPGLVKRLGGRLPLPLKFALGRAAGAVLAMAAAFRALPAAFAAPFRALPPVFATLPPVIMTLAANATASRGRSGSDRGWGSGGDPGVAFADQDFIVSLGSPWFHYKDYATRVWGEDGRRRVRFVMLVHDIIPLRRPEWCDRQLTHAFGAWLNGMMTEAHVIMADSQATADDLERYAAERGTPLKGKVTAIPLGSGFTDLHPRPPEADPKPLVEGDYALIVSTIEARKNHALLFRVWRRLLDEMPADQVPTLVFAGRVGWLVDDLMQQLENTGYLGGKIVVVRQPGDADLKQLYRGCLFTLMPSLYEGWGLPAVESLLFGKPCLLSNRTSLPEAGGRFARYFDPENLAEAYAVIRRTIEDREDLAAWEAEVRREFRPTPWIDTARALVGRIDAEGGAA